MSFFSTTQQQITVMALQVECLFWIRFLVECWLFMVPSYIVYGSFQSYHENKYRPSIFKIPVFLIVVPPVFSVVLYFFCIKFHSSSYFISDIVNAFQGFKDQESLAALMKRIVVSSNDTTTKSS